MAKSHGKPTKRSAVPLLKVGGNVSEITPLDSVFRSVQPRPMYACFGVGINGVWKTVDPVAESSCDEEEIDANKWGVEVVASVNRSDVMRFIEQYSKHSDDIQARGLWQHKCLADFRPYIGQAMAFIVAWINYENRSCEDRRLIDRIGFLQAVSHIVALVECLRIEFVIDAPCSKKVIGDIGPRLIYCSMEAGRLLQVILNEEAELAAERKLAEEERKNDVQSKRREKERQNRATESEIIESARRHANEYSAKHGKPIKVNALKNLVRSEFRRLGKTLPSEKGIEGKEKGLRELINSKFTIAEFSKSHPKRGAQVKRRKKVAAHKL